MRQVQGGEAGAQARERSAPRSTPTRRGTPKRYRFTGKEKDEESGLYYFGARYYAGWLGVWTSIDQKMQFESAYLYAGNGCNPINGVDRDGEKIEIIGTQEFKNEVYKALEQIKATPSGQKMYDELENSERLVTIASTTGQNRTKDIGVNSFMDGIKKTLRLNVPKDAEVSWNIFDTTGGIDVEGSKDRPIFIGLAHELGHALDFVRGVYRSKDINYIVN